MECEGFPIFKLCTVKQKDEIYTNTKKGKEKNTIISALPGPNLDVSIETLAYTELGKKALTYPSPRKLGKSGIIGVRKTTT